MTRMAFGAENCKGATSELTGKHYTSDAQGFMNVTDSRDVAFFKSNGFSIAGGMPRTSKYWVCDDCDWESNLNHCRYCDSKDLRKVEL